MELEVMSVEQRTVDSRSRLGPDGSGNGQTDGEESRASLMTLLGLAAGDVLTHVDVQGTVDLRALVQEMDWPSVMVMMAVGSLVREGLVRATMQGADLTIEPATALQGGRAQ